MKYPRLFRHSASPQKQPSRYAIRSRGVLGPALSLLLLWAGTATGHAQANPSPPPKAPGAGVPVELAPWQKATQAQWLRVYRDLHAHPELSLHEARTASIVAKALQQAGYEVHTGLGGHGVVGVLRNGPGPGLLLRGDMDALPIQEETGLPYASQARARNDAGEEVGVMHACGHDIHVSTLLATATFLAQHRQLWRGWLLIVAQPAEELGQGARDMLAAGLDKRFGRPDHALALHVAPDLPTGQVGYTPGWAFANVDSVDITVYGRGGHGARPHQANDPIVTAAHLVTALQTLVSRRLDPQAPAVVTVGSFHAGTKHNVIPDQASLQLTVRSYSDSVRNALLEGIQQLASDTCRAFQCPKPPRIEIKDDFTPSVYNDPAFTSAAVAQMRALLGADNVVEVPPTMGGEDFARYGRTLKIPSLLFRVGTVRPKTFARSQRTGQPLPSLHSSRFAPEPQQTLATAIQTLSVLALGALGQPER